MEEWIIPPLTLAAIAIVARLALQDLADLPLSDHLIGHPPARIGGRLHAHCKHLPRLLACLGDATGLVDRVRHRFFAVNVLAGLHGVNRHLGVPVIGRRDQHDVDVFVIEDLAIILRHSILVFALPIQPAFLGRIVEPATSPFPSSPLSTCHLPNVANPDDVDRLLLLIFHLEQNAEMLLGSAARAKDRDIDLFIGPLDRANGRMRKGPGGHHSTGRSTCCLNETPTAHLAIVFHRNRLRSSGSTTTAISSAVGSVSPPLAADEPQPD